MEQKFGHKIHELRTAKGYTQEQLATLCQVSSAAISKWENDLSFPDITLLPILARIFHISIDELLNFEPQLSEEEIPSLVNEVLLKLQEESFTDAMAYCRELVHTYPNSDILKLRLAMNAMYIMALCEGQEEQIQEYQEFAKELALDVYENTTSTELKETAMTILVDSYTMSDELDKAEELLKEFPTHVDSRTMLSNLYLQQEKYTEAHKLSQELLYEHYHQINLHLLNLTTLSKRMGKKDDIAAYLKLMEDVQTCFHMEEDANFLPITEGYYDDPAQALKNLKRYIDQLQHWDDMTKMKAKLLKATLWFQDIEMQDRPMPAIMSKEQLIKLLDDEGLDYLRCEKEFQELYEHIQQL